VEGYGGGHSKSRRTHGPRALSKVAGEPPPGFINVGPGKCLINAYRTGFSLGLWQGFVGRFVFVASLFKSNLSIYKVHNNGAWYNFGYLFGLACFLGGGGNRAARRK
jgi:hypothetical protein